MKVLLKNISSIFLLFLFLFPLVEKEMHALEHADDFHCSSVDKHFHELEHSCSICDYTIPATLGSSNNSFHFVFNEQIISFNLYTDCINIPTAYQDIPSRAPPIC
jgi:hypothetical protein